MILCVAFCFQNNVQTHEDMHTFVIVMCYTCRNRMCLHILSTIYGTHTHNRGLILFSTDLIMQYEMPIRLQLLVEHIAIFITIRCDKSKMKIIIKKRE